MTSFLWGYKNEVSRMNRLATLEVEVDVVEWRDLNGNDSLLEEG